MENFIKKVIRASAGTGKTYRLSLEYIGLLLKFHPQNIHFSEILVITFTKKATAEIRERIFEHLKDIINETNKGKELCQNLNSILGIKVTTQDLTVLKSYYQEMLLNKNLVQISTIDSFTNAVFKTIIAPYLGITDYKIDNKISKELLAELYQSILAGRDLDILKDFFLRSGRKNIEDYEKLIRSILGNRWIFHFIENNYRERAYEKIPEEYVDEMLINFKELYFKVLDRFQKYIERDQSFRSIDEVVKKDFFECFFEQDKNASVFNTAKIIKQKFINSEFISENQKVIFDQVPFWNGGKMLRKNADKELAEELKADMETSTEFLAEYIFYKELLPEEAEIKEITNRILSRYDEIKFREKVFTYNDISYYTFKYLYDPDLSLIDREYVTNAFYEYLSTYIRFVLIDEFQDTSIIQFKILLPIIKEVISGYGAKDYGGAIVVGDEKQSIYGWRGGERDLLIKMPKILGESQQVTLNTSYRSEKNIIQFINDVFSESYLNSKLKEKNIVWQYEKVNAHRENEAGYIQVNYRNYSNTEQDKNDINQEESALREFMVDVLNPLITQKKLSLAGTAILARRNKDLQYMANILDELGIDYILESSSSVLHHRTIKPILFLLRFLVYKDIYDLLKFLRSDLILIGTKDLKEILLTYRDFNKNEFNVSKFFDKLSAIEAVKKVNNFIFDKSQFDSKPDISENNDLLNFTKKIIEEYNVIGIFNLENDIKNINLFLEVIAEFENDNRDYPKNLKGFISFCEDIEHDEEYQQLGLESINAINLLSIHKAKGLEFDNVFLYWNISGRAGLSYGKLNSYLDYEADYSQLNNYLLTYNYEHILPLSQSRGLKEQSDIKEVIEILNTFYVAATRPKLNLFIYFSYKKSGGLTKLFEGIETDKKISVVKLLAYGIYNVFAKKGLLNEHNANQIRAKISEIVTTEQKVTPSETIDFSFIKNYLDVDRLKYLTEDKEKIEKERQLDFKVEYLEKQSLEIGNVAHYYLSFIKYNREQERNFATARTIGFYGALLPVQKIKIIIKKVDGFIASHSEMFSAIKWDRVFNEHTIFSPDGQEFRLDRLMIDKKNKQVEIIDYKTGETYKEKQIIDYINAVKSLNVVKEENYQVEGRYEVIEI